MTRNSRSTACADGRSSPSGCLRKTYDRPSARRRYVGFDWPPLNRSTASAPRIAGTCSRRYSPSAASSSMAVLLDEVAAVDGQAHARGVARRGRYEIEHGARDLLRLRDALHRDVLEVVAEQRLVLNQSGGELRLGDAGKDRVHAHAEFRAFGSANLGLAGDRGLGDRGDALVRAGDDAADRG